MGPLLVFLALVLSVPSVCITPSTLPHGPLFRGGLQAVFFCTFSCTVFTARWCVCIFNLHKWLVFHILFCFLLFPTNTPFLKRIHPAVTFSALLWIIAQHVRRWPLSTCPTGNSADGQESLTLYPHNSKAKSKYKYPRRFSCLGQGKTFSWIHTSLWNICVWFTQILQVPQQCQVTHENTYPVVRLSQQGLREF